MPSAATQLHQPNIIAFTGKLSAEPSHRSLLKEPFLVTTFPQLLLHCNTARKELPGFVFKSQRLLLIYMEYIRDETWKKKNPVPSSVQQNQIFLLGLPFLWQERQRSTHFSVLDISLGIQDLGRAFFISATRNIAFEVQSYIFKKKVLILVLQEVERLQ